MKSCFELPPGVNLPRWGLKLKQWRNDEGKILRVNLPRWGLKRSVIVSCIYRSVRVNLPRWGLKQG